MFRTLQVEFFQMRLRNREDLHEGNLVGFVTGLAVTSLTAASALTFVVGFLLCFTAPAFWVMYRYHHEQSYNAVSVQQKRAVLVGAVVVSYSLFLTFTLMSNLVWPGLLPGLTFKR